ncbi:hypothetical protein NDU88_005313 [Pleurodeles waltl]|uniref:Uncharacterized protein n=1 Tax=Pleurodeles waltl TaxID=8319 RepID=A0AAV7RNQ8_PLEWA|nr:hypothetical protein NDU88_005313 [Pleurodeles waltl]
MEASKLSDSSGAAVLHRASQLLYWCPHGMPMAFGAPIGAGQRRPRATPRPTSSGARDSADPGRGGATGPAVFPTGLLLCQFGVTLRWADYPWGAGFGTSVCGSTWVRALAAFVRHPCLQSLLRSRSRAGAGRAARVSAPVFGLSVSGPLNHGARLPRSRPFSALPTACVVTRWAPLSDALDGVAPLGAAPAAPVGPRRPGSVCRLLGGLSWRAVPDSGVVWFPGRRRSLTAAGTPELRILEVPESGGHQDTPRVPAGTKQD